MRYSYDPKCEELALHFLAGNQNARPGDMRELAQALQDAAEAHLSVIDGRAISPPQQGTENG